MVAMIVRLAFVAGMRVFSGLTFASAWSSQVMGILMVIGGMFV